MSKISHFQRLILRRKRRIGVQACLVVCVGLATMSLLTSCRVRSVLLKKPERTRMPDEIASAVSPFKLFDRRPYELIWSKKEEQRTPLVDFSNLAGWRVESSPGTEVVFASSQEKQLWGSAVGKLHYQGGGGDSWIELSPPEPLPLKEVFDAAGIWVWTPPVPEDTGTPSSPMARLDIRLRDAQDRRVELTFGLVPDMQWYLLHTVLEETLEGPCRLESLYISELKKAEAAAIYLDSLSFYKERRSAIRSEALPNPLAGLLPGQTQDSEGKKNLVFPEEEHAVCPALPTDRYHTSIKQLNDSMYALNYQTEKEQLEYRIDLARGIEGIRVFWNNNSVGILTHGAHFEGLPTFGKVQALREENGELRVEYDAGIVLTLRLCGRTLQVDVTCRGGEAKALHLGQLEEVLDPKRVALPFLRHGTQSNWPVYHVGMPSADESGGLFISVLLDPYRSNASSHVLPSSALANPQMQYEAKTDGGRNDVHERFYLSVAPRINDILPTVGRKPGARGSALVPLVWRGFFGHRNSRTVDAADARLSQYGMKSMVFAGGQKCWSDQDDSFSFRTRAAPYQGGDEGLWSFLADYKELAGWQVGLYANFFTLSPLNAYWDEALLARDGHGQWIPGPRGTFLTKAQPAADLGRKITPELLQKFKPDVLLLDLASISPPGRATDFDARVGTAGTFSQVYYTYGCLLQNISKDLGTPVVATGGSEWLYAGLVDAFVLKEEAYTVESLYPLLPVFSLGAINPLSCLYGPPFQDTGEPEALDRFLAMQIAYGMGGRLAVLPDISSTARSYYMLQALQERYQLSRPRRLTYFNGERMVSSSTALETGSYKESQLYVHYESDLEVWVNGSAVRPWDIRVGREDYQLPPYGWAAQGPDFLELSIVTDGHRVDYVQAPGMTYYDGRGYAGLFRGISATGPLLINTSETRVEVTNIGSMQRLGLGPEMVKFDASVVVEGFSAAGLPLRVKQSRDRDGMLWLEAKVPPQRLVIRPGNPPSP